MYDFAFDYRNLERELKRSDFSGHPTLVDEAVRATIIRSAVGQAYNGFRTLALDESSIRGKTLYQFTLLPQDLVLRKLGSNIRILTKVKQSNRDTVIRSLKALFAEGHDFRVYKLDVRHFYESLSRDYIEHAFATDSGFPAASLFVYRSFNKKLTDRGIPGLPRGLSISAVLSEYAMRRFDNLARSQPSVYFYARYVDDILIVTRGDEKIRSFLKLLRRSLPDGLHFNAGKSRVHDFNAPKVGKTAATVEHAIDFLGYQFEIFGKATHSSDNVLRRTINVDMAPGKVRRIKTRIVLSARRFAEDGNYPDLFDRLRFLTGNFNIYDYNKKLRRNVGISWNYQHITHDTSPALAELDGFLKKILLSKTGPIAVGLSQLTPCEKNRLLSLSFRNSFRQRLFYHFSASRLSQLVGVWSYA